MNSRNRNTAAGTRAVKRIPAGVCFHVRCVRSNVAMQSSECRLALENCEISGLNESMNAESHIIHFSLTANPRPTVLKSGGDF
jgi:hypothetical protein